MADRSFQSFFALLKLKKEGGYDKKVRIPHYRERGGLFGLTLSTNAINIRSGWLQVPMSRAFSKSHDGKVIRIRVPERMENRNIKEVRIVPSCHGRYFRIQYVYEDEGFDLYMSQNRILAIDVGLDNLAACITTLGTIHQPALEQGDGETARHRRQAGAQRPHEAHGRHHDEAEQPGEGLPPQGG